MCVGNAAGLAVLSEVLSKWLAREYAWLLWTLFEAGACSVMSSRHRWRFFAHICTERSILNLINMSLGVTEGYYITVEIYIANQHAVLSFNACYQQANA